MTAEVGSKCHLHLFDFPAVRRAGSLAFFSCLYGLSSAQRALRSYAGLSRPLPFPALEMTAPDTWEAPIVAQATTIYDYLNATIEREKGAILFYGIYVTDMRDYPTLVRARSAKFPDGISPPCTCSQVSSMPFPGAVVCFDVIGYIRGTNSRDEFRVIDSETGKQANYQIATRLGPYLFFAGIVAPEAAVKPFRLTKELTKNGGLARSSLNHQARAQTEEVCRNLCTLIESQGGNLSHLKKINVYLTNLADLASVEDVLRDWFVMHPPAMSVVEVHSLARPDFVVEIEGIAYLDEPEIEAPEFPMTVNIGFNPVVRVLGKLIAVSGIIAWDADLGRLTTSPTDIEAIGRQLVMNALSSEDRRRPDRISAAVQTWHIMEQFRRGLASIGGLSALAKMTVYVRDLYSFNVIETVIKTVLQSERPAITVLEPSSLPLKGAEVMIEAIADSTITK